jgi:membrane-bound lytic murein transglycosylase A
MPRATRRAHFAFSHAPALLLALALSACRHAPPSPSPSGDGPALIELAPAEFPPFEDDFDEASLLRAIDQSLAHFVRLARAEPARRLTFGTEKVPATRVADTLRAFRELVASHPSPDALNEAIRRDYRVFQSRGADERRTVTFTGYYLPELTASPVRTERYAWPLHAVPKDLVVVRGKRFPGLAEDVVGRVVDGELVPYATRAEVRTAGLEKAGTVAWVESAVDAFFLEIQGSGVLAYEDGTRRVATFAGRNGHPYVAIGNELLRRGEPRQTALSMQGIRRWLDEHPDARHEVMDANPSYVFFRLADDAIGSLGVPVTGGRTLATDFRVFPKGALCFASTTHPSPDGDRRSVRRFMLDQDTGGAIRTAGHVDFFFGAGREAEATAGRMKQDGALYYLLKR